MSTRLLLAALLLVATPVWAQVTPPQSPPANQPSPLPSRRDVLVDRRIKDLHDALHITAAQQPAFDGFAAAMRDNAQRMDEAVGPKHASQATDNAVDQLRNYVTLAQLHAEEVQRLVGPFTALYGTLSPQQQKSADASFRSFATKARERAMRG